MNRFLKPLVFAFFLLVVGLPISNAQTSQLSANAPTASPANEGKRTIFAVNSHSEAIPNSAVLSSRDHALVTSTSKPASNGLQFGDESGWEIFLAGGGSFWSSQETLLSINDIVTVTPDPGLGSIPVLNTKYRIRQSFAPGGRVGAGVVKNFNERSAVEFSYLYGTNNFRLTALEALGRSGPGYGYTGTILAPEGYSRSLGMRSHIAAINYRHSFANNDQARWYLTGGFNVTVFQPTNEGLDQLFGLGPSSASLFTQRPHFKTVAAPGVNFSGGVIVKASDTVGFRFDVRDYLSFTRRVRGSATLTTGEKIEVNLFGDTIHNLVPTVGVVFMPK
jgi:hypothetical protein